MSADNLPRPANPGPWSASWDLDDRGEFVLDMRSDLAEDLPSRSCEDVIRWDPDLHPDDGEVFDDAWQTMKSLSALHAWIAAHDALAARLDAVRAELGRIETPEYPDEFPAVVRVSEVNEAIGRIRTLLGGDDS